jgi:adenylosuccinate synthase
VVVRYSVRVNGFDTLALTKLDVLDEQAEIKICTAYRRDNGETLTEFPADLSLLDGSEAVYETIPDGRSRRWACAISRCCRRRPSAT